MKHSIAGKSLEEWEELFPLLSMIMQTKEVFWKNNRRIPFEKAVNELSVTLADIEEADTRLRRFAPFIAKEFPETAKEEGVIESSLLPIPHMKSRLESVHGQNLEGTLFLKGDHQLKVAGSIKSRGGFHEVFKYAEALALKHGIINKQDNYEVFAEPETKEFFRKYSLVVGSTGNLGLSIGIIGSALGFKVIVHMSQDARQWKKELLRQLGVKVVEHKEDYGRAITEGRRQAEEDPSCHFVDDENSLDLFLGYATAALRVKTQLEEKGIVIHESNKLSVYLPCGVGGGPGGVALGLKLLYKDNVRCFFAEPAHAPAMLLGMMTGEHDRVSVQDFGIDNRTAADGLAVGRPSAFVGNMLRSILDGIFTVSDSRLFQLLYHAADTENLQLEPSALAGMAGPFLSGESKESAVHLVWATGGSMVPIREWQDYWIRGKKEVTE